MHRAERVYLLLKQAGPGGLNTYELARKSGLSDPRKAVSEMKKMKWMNRGEYLQTKREQSSWFGFFPRNLNRYFITNTRN